METGRRDGETPLQYHKRLVYGKLVDHTLSDVDYSELSELAYGQPYSSDVARRMFYGSKKTLELMDEERLDAEHDIGSDIDMKIVEFKKEQQKFYDQRNAFNKLVRDNTREEEFIDIVRQTLKSGEISTFYFSEGSCSPTDYEHGIPQENDLLVSLNDIHYGIEIHNAWNDYNPEICADMFQGYFDNVLKIASIHQSRDCIVYNCGDNISGNIHRTLQIANRENIVKQIMQVSELIADFLGGLAEHFHEVRYVNVSGNHSRLGDKDDVPYDERLDDIVEWYLKAKLQDKNNIKICSENRIDPTMFLINIRGKWYCGVHGDYDATPANIAALQNMCGHPLYAVLSGHRHYNKCDEVQGIKTMMAGCFVGSDDYCITKRIFGRPEQLVSVCTDDGILCHYDVQLKQDWIK